MSTLNGHFGDILKATDIATISMGVGMEFLVERFTYADELDQYEDKIITKSGMSSKSWMYLGGLLNSLITEAKDMANILIPDFDKEFGRYITATQDMFSMYYATWLFGGTFEPEKPDHNT